MEVLWKCAALGIAASLLSLAMRKEREEQALLLGLAAALAYSWDSLRCGWRPPP